MMTLEQAKAILAAVVPDQSISPEERAKIAEAMRIVSGAWARRPS